MEIKHVAANVYQLLLYILTLCLWSSVPVGISGSYKLVYYYYSYIVACMSCYDNKEGVLLVTEQENQYIQTQSALPAC